MERVQTVGDAEDTIRAFERVFERSLVSDVGLDDLGPFSSQCCNMTTESDLHVIPRNCRSNCTFGSGTVGVAGESTHGKGTVFEEIFSDTSSLGTRSSCDDDNLL